MGEHEQRSDLVVAVGRVDFVAVEVREQRQEGGQAHVRHLDREDASSSVLLSFFVLYDSVTSQS